MHGNLKIYKKFVIIFTESEKKLPAFELPYEIKEN